MSNVPYGILNEQEVRGNVEGGGGGGEGDGEKEEGVKRDAMVHVSDLQ